jgi:carboxypeptidase family protein/TonB-dependent receptor-like protein
VAGALITLIDPQTQKAHADQTDYAGRSEFRDLAAGSYRLRVVREGFYEVTKEGVEIRGGQELEVTMNHQQEYYEKVNVVASPPVMDPAKTASSEKLTTREIIDLPYVVPRDIRYALPMIPGVLQDATGQLHLDGSSTRQINDQLDGFDITDPVTGLFQLRVSVDALRSADVESSRAPAEDGKGAGGIIALSTGMGDNRWRYTATNLPPSLSATKGLHINTWTPRASVSGPIRKDRAWFLDAMEAEYSIDLVNELPRGQDRNSVTRFGNLVKAQVNLTPSNNLTASYLVNTFHSPHVGLSLFNPIPTTTSEADFAGITSLKDQQYFSNGTLVEAGFAVDQFYDKFWPMGTEPYVLNPEGSSGNYFEQASSRARRVEGIGDIMFPEFAGHQIKLGFDFARIIYHQAVERQPYSILREDGTLDRQVSFVNLPPFQKDNFEFAGYAQDRFSPTPRLLLEAGLRLDGDEILRRALVSPRLAASYMLSAHGETKIVAGVGRTYDRTNLQLITSGLSGLRTDSFYDLSGKALLFPPVETQFLVDDRALLEPWSLNWSAGVERKLFPNTDVKVEFIQKIGHDEWAFENLPAAAAVALSGTFVLANIRRDHYHAVTATVRQSFGHGHLVFASYTRSSARSTAVLPFSLDSPLFSQQEGGPLPWDTPNRVVTWGFLPLVKGFDLAYLADWRDGFPISVFNQDQELVGAPGSRRFPTYFSLNMALEKRIPAFGFLWSLRAGFDDLTNRHNPDAVDSNVNSPTFLTFSSEQSRALTAQVRFLGRK